MVDFVAAAEWLVNFPSVIEIHTTAKFIVLPDQVLCSLKHYALYGILSICDGLRISIPGSRPSSMNCPRPFWMNSSRRSFPCGSMAHSSEDLRWTHLTTRTKYANMKEPRFRAGGGIWRVAFAFDPQRNAVLLVTGDKSGVSEKKFYKRLIEKAGKRYSEHLDNF